MNELSQSESLYLQQHASNPVHWKMWNKEAFIKAKSDHKPVLVSIGYAACHWCHVMEHESFEDEVVAAFMNKHFVCIKVDREEHPEVDHLYMDALIAMTNQGGWPLNMFVTPDRKPFYGGTYFPPERMYGRASWIEVLQSIQKYWTEQQEEIQMQATQLLQHLSQANKSPTILEKEAAFNPALVYQNIMLQADEAQGGFGKAPKFPATHTMNYLLVDSFVHQREEGVHHVYFTIQKMLHSGIYDAVGGGLCRYAVDDDWMIPHFEKMLYDNALFLSLLSNAYRLKPMESLKEGIKGILKWCTGNWKDTDGLYFSASDADSERVEGKYYVWTYAELLTLITMEEEILFEYYQIVPEGNWENGFNILHAAETTIKFCERKSTDHTHFLSLQQSFLQKLFKKRKDRVAPAIDNKKQLSWNALYNIALCDAFAALQIDLCAEEAVLHMEILLSHFWQDGYLLHLNYGSKQLIANADDWAYLIKALVRLANTTKTSRYIKEAEKILEWGHMRYYSEEEEMYCFSDVAKQDVLVRKIDTHDNAFPSVNAVMAENLLVLGIVTKRTSWVSMATTINAKMKSMVQRYPGSFANAASNLILEDLLKVIEVDNVSSLSWIAGFQSAYNPDVVLLPSQNINEKQAERGNQGVAIEKSSILVCTKYACHIPDNLLSMRFEKYC